MLHNSANGFGSIVIGPQMYRGRSVILRAPRFDDFDDWRSIRLRDQARIEPHWITDPLPWDARHTRRRWIRECLEARTAAAEGTAISLVVEVDGRLRGQCSLTDIDPDRNCGEVGTWVDSELPGAGLLVSTMLMDHALLQLGIRRTVMMNGGMASPAGRACARIGLRLEATMTESFHIGGTRQDQSLWAADTDLVPAGGFVDAMRETHRKFFEGDVLPAGDTGTTSPASVRARLQTAAEYARYALGQRRRAWRARHRPAPTDIGRPGDRVILRADDSGSVAVQGYTTYTVTVDGEAVGSCGLHAGDWARSTAELWVAITRVKSVAEHAADALRAMTAHSIEELGLHRVSIMLLADDSPNRAAARSAGMVCEGTMINTVDPRRRRGDHELWAITAPAWRASAAVGN